jgi:uncharacterized protein YwgA
MDYQDTINKAIYIKESLNLPESPKSEYDSYGPQEIHSLLKQLKNQYFIGSRTEKAVCEWMQIINKNCKSTATEKEWFDFINEVGHDLNDALENRRVYRSSVYRQNEFQKILETPKDNFVWQKLDDELTTKIMCM